MCIPRPCWKKPNRAPSPITLMSPPGPHVPGTPARGTRGGPRRDHHSALPPRRNWETHYSSQGEPASAPREASPPSPRPRLTEPVPTPREAPPRRPGPAPPPDPTLLQDRVQPGPTPVGNGLSLSLSVVWRSVTLVVRARGPLSWRRPWSGHLWTRAGRSCGHAAKDRRALLKPHWRAECRRSGSGVRRGWGLAGVGRVGAGGRRVTVMSERPSALPRVRTCRRPASRGMLGVSALSWLRACVVCVLVGLRVPSGGSI